MAWKGAKINSCLVTYYRFITVLRSTQAFALDALVVMSTPKESVQANDLVRLTSQQVVDVLASAGKEAADRRQQRPNDQQRSCVSAISTCDTGNNSISLFAGAASAVILHCNCHQRLKDTESGLRGFVITAVMVNAYHAVHNAM